MGLSDCVSSAFTTGPIGELKLADTCPAVCPWPQGQLNSPNALRYDPANGLWIVPPGFPSASGSATVPVHLSAQGGQFTSSVAVTAGSAIWEPSTSDPAFISGPSTALNPVTLTNPSAELSMGFVGWADYYTKYSAGNSVWPEMWGALWYPGSAWPDTQGNWDALRSLSLPINIFVHMRARRAVVLTVPAGGSAVVSARIGVRNLIQAGGTTAIGVTNWNWDLWGLSFMLDPIAQG